MLPCVFGVCSLCVLIVCFVVSFEGLILELTCCFGVYAWLLFVVLIVMGLVLIVVICIVTVLTYINGLLCFVAFGLRLIC